MPTPHQHQSVRLLRPCIALLPEYVDALERGWSPDNLRPEATREQLAETAQSPEAFIASLEDRTSKGNTVTLPDGTRVPRLPGFRRWIWQDGFCGVIGVRWQSGTEELPPTCSGHIGYAILPWRRNEGLASAALIAFLPEVRKTGLRHVDLTTSPENRASIRVMQNAGAEFVERFRMHPSLGGEEAVKYRISLSETSSGDSSAI